MSNSVIIPTNGSECAEKAAETGFELVGKLDATVHAHSVSDENLAEISSVGTAPPRSTEDVAEMAAEWAADLAAKAEAHGLEAETVVRTGLERRTIGSVTDRVVRTAPVPVVTVRPDGSIDTA